MRWPLPRVLPAGVLLFGICLAQSPSFEVASLKRSPPPAGDLYRANLGSVLHGELTMTNCALSDCLRFAYGISNDLQIDGPEWVKDKGVRFDVLAKSAPSTPRDQFPVMLRGLLAERFDLRLHHEERAFDFLGRAIAIGLALGST